MTSHKIDELSEVAVAAIEIGRERRKKMKQLRTALKSNDDEKALDLAREIVGLSKEENQSAA